MIEAGLLLGIDHHDHLQAKMIKQLPEMNMVDGRETKPAAAAVLVHESAAAGTGSLQADHHHQMMNNIRCPRCDSPNTKFCYYNNYNLTQPRHFCKSCRRYWTKGGALRNVPFGGGCRKNKNTNTNTNTRCSNKQQHIISKSGSDMINYSPSAPTTCTTTTTNYHHMIFSGTNNSPNIINTSSHHDHQPNSSSGSMSAIPLHLPAINSQLPPPVPNLQISYQDHHQYYSPGAGAGGGYLPFLLQAAAGNNVNLQSKNNVESSNCFIANYGASWPRSSSAAAAGSGLFNINNNEVMIRNYNQNLNNLNVNGKVLFNNIISNQFLEDQSGEQQQKMPPPTLLFPLIPAAAHGSSSSWGSSTSNGCYVEMPAAAYQAAAAASNSNMQVRDAMPAVVPVSGEMGFWSAPLAWSDVQATTTTSTGAAASS